MKKMALLMAFGLSACVIKVQEHPGNGSMQRAEPVYTPPPVARPHVQQHAQVAPGQYYREDDRHYRNEKAMPKGMIVYADHGRKHHHGQGHWLHHHGDGNTNHAHRGNTYNGPTYAVQQQREPVKTPANMGLRPFVQGNAQPAQVQPAPVQQPVVQPQRTRTPANMGLRPFVQNNAQPVPTAPASQAQSTAAQQPKALPQRERIKAEYQGGKPQQAYQQERKREHQPEKHEEQRGQQQEKGLIVKNEVIQYGQRGSRFQGMHHHGDEHWHHHHGDGNYNHQHKGRKFSGRIFY